MEVLIIKIGGNVIDNQDWLTSFLELFTKIKQPKILVHGGGKLATEMASKLGVVQQMIDGRRITDAETLRIVTMVYAGLINKNVVAKLQQQGCNAIGLSGVDGNLIKAHKRVYEQIDFGYVGDIDNVNEPLLKYLLESDFAPVIATISHDGKGQLLNTNADTIAQEIAQALSSFFDTKLIYCFEKKGVLLDVTDEESVVPLISANYFEQLKKEEKVHSGMLPKLHNAFQALDRGVKRVVIGSWEQILSLKEGSAGTSIVHDK